VSLPNVLTILRIVLIPAFATAYIYDQRTFALVLFTAAAVTDALDGFIARFTHQQTKLGSFLDPIADKFLMLTSFALVTFTGLVPVWALILVMSREVIIVGGWMIRHFLTRSSSVVPSVLGKATTFAQIVAIVLFLLSPQLREVREVMDLALYAAMALTALSGLDYLFRGMKELEKRA